MGDFWRAQDRPDLGQVWLVRVKDPGRLADASDLVYLEQDPAGLDASKRVAKVNYGSIPPLKFTKDMVPGTVYGYDGETQTFSVTATGGKAPLSYQWRKRNGTTYTNVGPNADTYEFVSGNGSGGAYSVVVTDADGKTITSQETILTWTAQLTFTTQPPETAAVAVGSPLSLASAATGGVGARKYQWYKDGVSLGTANGAATNTYAKTMAAGDAGTYTVKVTDTNPNGAKTITSRNSVVTVAAA